jgi:nitrogen-specific signal transduction histidine kinase
VTNLSGVLGETVRLLRRVMPAMIDLRFTTEPDLTAILAVKPKSNRSFSTCRECPRCHAMRIEVRNYGGAVATTVRDMSPEVLGRIREPYFATRSATCGTRLGLAMVARILDEHRAVLLVESTVGKGGTFHILFACPKMD